MSKHKTYSLFSFCLYACRRVAYGGQLDYKLSAIYINCTYLLWVVFSQDTISVELLQHILQLLGGVWGNNAEVRYTFNTKHSFISQVWFTGIYFSRWWKQVWTERSNKQQSCLRIWILWTYLSAPLRAEEAFSTMIDQIINLAFGCSIVRSAGRRTPICESELW